MSKVKPGAGAALTKLPPGLLDGLPKEDQKAISEIVGKAILLAGYDADGRAELEFKDREGIIHFIYVAPHFIRPAKPRRS
jgi:hypothetical protein